MVIFTWICLGLVSLLMAASGICWLLFILLDDSDWRRLGSKVFRYSLVFVLLYINIYVYAHIVRAVL
jgi:hypothetical protein